MAKVNVLDRHTAELIAAGEVVERPASVVKELVENSIDAGARTITVEIKNGGISLIRVTDDGDGIDRDDVKTAFLRHATSKIRTGDDLEAIGTLGFRGEALASIAAVSRVELFTRTAEQDSGVRYIIEGGDEISFEDWGCAKGTTIIIRDIFYNTPARMKFLKKDSSEANAIAAILDRIALSHPEISLRLISDGKQILQTTGDGKLKSAIYAVFGKDFTDGMIPVEYDYNGVKVVGFTSKPAYARPNRSMQIFFINGRYCRSVTMQKALETGYKGSIMVGKYPACVLGIEIPPGAVDVNVHPSKMEVRFTNERPIFESVYYAIKSAVMEKDERREVSIPTRQPQDFFKKQNVEPSGIQTKINTEEERIPQENEQINNIVKKPYYDERIIFTDVASGTEKRANDAGVADPGVYRVVDLPVPKNSIESETDLSNKETVSDAFKLANYRIIGELLETYILIESGEQLILIDKHAAHERLIYERLRAYEGGREPQLLLTPAAVTLDKSQYDAALGAVDIFSDAGFEIEDFGPGTLLVRAVPLALVGGDIEGAVQEISGELPYLVGKPSTERLDKMFHSIACRAAVKAHDRSTYEELAQLALALEARPDLRHCPHGRPISVALTRREIEKNFGRIQ